MWLLGSSRRVGAVDSKPALFVAADSEQWGLGDRQGQKERTGRGSKWVPFYSDAGRVSSCSAAAVDVAAGGIQQEVLGPSYYSFDELHGD